MNHELAKQLKEAGFKTLMGFPVSNADDGLYYPTLSELIEACGERFYSVEMATSKDPDKHRFWRATADDLPMAAQLGSTPEEAVANLWLALHVK